MALTTDQELIVNFYETIGNNVKGHLADVKEGPVVNNFIFTPSNDVSMDKMRKISSQNGFMVFPIANTNSVVFQIPKYERQSISLDDLINNSKYNNTNTILPIILGVDTFGNIKIADLQTLPHLLIGGRVGTGKSTFIKSILKSLTTKLSPSECRIIIMDTKYYNITDGWEIDKHLTNPVSTDLNKCFGRFNYILELMDKRYRILNENNVKNIKEYHDKTHNIDMLFIVVVIDELADFICSDQQFTETFVMAICQKARSVGIHLIIATQKVDLITEAISAHFATRLSFQARTSKDSEIILDEPGAELLLCCGDMLFSEAGKMLVRIHSPYIED